MKHGALLLLMAALVALAQGGAGVEGNWLGTLDLGAAKLRLALKVAKSADGSLSATLDSLDQGATDMPVSAIRQTGVNVEFDLKQIGGAYRGALTADGSELTGTWKQGPGSLALTFRRVAETPVLNRPQDPKRPYPYDEEEVSYENKAGGAKLAGTLTVPRGTGPFPVVLLITGSGQQDRNETIMGHRPFLLLADYLTRKGVAVLRVDDRGVGGSTGDVKNATSEDFAGDVLAGVEFLKGRGAPIDLKRIGLIGHSEGGMIAPMVAVRSRDVAFLVLMAGAGVPGDEVLYEQAAALAKASGATAEAIAQNRKLQEQMNAIIKREKNVDKRSAQLTKLKNSLGVSNAALSAQFQMAASPWFRYFIMYDPGRTLRKVHVPVLALNGDLDLQVLSAQNLPAIERALKVGGNPDFQIVKLPKLNHGFQTSRTGNPAEYASTEETIAPVALETISDWILKHTAH